MAIPFARTMRLLTSDTSARDLRLLAFGGALLAAWLAWLIRARVPIYEVSPTARLAADGAPSPVQAFIAGRVHATHLVLGERVRAGDVLVELDATAASLTLQQRRHELDALISERTLFGDELAKERQLSQKQLRSDGLAVEEARARQQEATLTSAAAADQARRTATLAPVNAATPAELVRTRLEADAREAASQASRLTASRRALDRDAASSEGALRLARLERQLGSLAQQIAVAQVAVERARTELEQHQVRAAASGYLGEVADFRPGAVVGAGEKLALIVPDQTLVVVADVPASALGRVSAGQRAIVKLAGFPWTQYGTLSARVFRISSEAHNGSVRVELELDEQRTRSIPLQHGLTGTVEIAVEEVAPITLVLRRLAWTGAR